MDAVGKLRVLLGTCVVTTLVLAQVPAGAITSSTTSAPTSATPAPSPAPSTFVAGSAAATSQAFALNPRDAGLAATVTIGQSIADYRDTLAQASSQALNLGLVGANLTVQCSSLPPVLTAGELPKPLSAESDTGAGTADKSAAGPDAKSARAATGREAVSVSPQPDEAAAAAFDGERVELPGLLDVSGLSSTAHARLVNGQARIASATADVAKLDLLGGKVALDGLHWQVSARSGTHPSVSRSFRLGSVTIAGVKLPTLPDALSSTLAAVNKALASTGLHISLPTATHQSGIYGISPLSIGIDDSKLGSELFVPILNLLHTLIDPTMSAITNAVCQIGSVYTTVNLLLTAISGVGAVDAEFGGATATTDDTTYANPFGDGGTPPSLPATGATTTPGGGGQIGPASGGGAPPTLPVTSPVPAPNQSPEVAGTRVLSSSCSTTSAAGRPSCSRGAGLAVGLIALATLGGVAAADFLVSRRRRKLAAMAIDS
ncbi:MAG TPA: hypothetical protein VHD58_11790 [Mycobacteriales bacterium]|nr:hypothetical protein [Mycobacteriales bacterium]